MSTKLKIGIVGLGLIGGSLEKKLLEHADKYELFTVSQSQQREHKLEDLGDVDLLFLCGSQSQILKDLEKIALIISRSGEEGKKPASERAFANTIITDVASTKKIFADKAVELGLENYVPGHPMAGNEKRGYEASSADLFKAANWVLTESSERTKKLEEIITKTLEAKLVLMDPQTHDLAVSFASHLPLVLSLALARSLKANPNAAQVAGPGFTGMTRLAGGNIDLGKEIITINRSNIKTAWQNFKQEVDVLLGARADDLASEMIDIKEQQLQCF